MFRVSSTPQTSLRSAIAVLCLVAIFSARPASAKERGDETGVPSIEQKVEGMVPLDGFFPMHWDVGTGKLWLEISRFDTEILYLSGLSAGLGSNDIGLDRGQMGSRLVVFRRVGPKVLMVQPNYRFRADSEDPDERRAVEEAFAPVQQCY